jgi:hypothetical protein
MGQFEHRGEYKMPGSGYEPQGFQPSKGWKPFQLLRLLLAMLTKAASEAEYKGGMNNYRADRYSCIGIQAVE